MKTNAADRSCNADRLTIHVSSVHRRLKRAERLVRRYLEDRGFDAGWLAEAA